MNSWYKGILVVFRKYAFHHKPTTTCLNCQCKAEGIQVLLLWVYHFNFTAEYSSKRKLFSYILFSYFLGLCECNLGFLFSTNRNGSWFGLLLLLPIYFKVLKLVTHSVSTMLLVYLTFFITSSWMLYLLKRLFRRNACFIQFHILTQSLQ